MLVQARPRLLAKTLRRKMGITSSKHQYCDSLLCMLNSDAKSKPKLHGSIRSYFRHTVTMTIGIQMTVIFNIPYGTDADT